jgi:hypothetical protein
MKLDRLKVLVGLRQQWRGEIDELRRMQGWLVNTEQILAGQWRAPREQLTNATVAKRFDAWCAHLVHLQATEKLRENEQRCLTHFLHITQGLRPHLIQCYDRADFPRTNNEMEGYIRALKTRYRRVSGRKNWNGYLLRYGRCISYYDWAAQECSSPHEFEQMLAGVDHRCWQATRRQCRREQSDQLKRYRFRRQRERYLLDLEARWAATGAGTRQLP